MTMNKVIAEIEASIIDPGELKENSELVVHNCLDEKVNDLNSTHLWFCDLDQQFSPAWLSLLSTSERGRADRLKTPQERQRFAVRCAFTRHLLGAITNQPPESLQFSNGVCGKPQLAGPASGSWGDTEGLPHFNLSHCENVLGMAVAFGREVGIDLEVVKTDIDPLALAAVHFSREDYELLWALPANVRSHRFYRLWTRREALAKMEGNGIVEQRDVGPAAIAVWKMQSFEFALDKELVAGAVALEDPHRYTRR